MSRLAHSRALWNRSRFDLRSEEILAQLLDRGNVADWRELYARARSDGALRERIARVVDRVPLAYGHFWMAALESLGHVVDWDHELPGDEPGAARTGCHR
jgi:hypothetical protein